jgi:hypothetical protein
LPLIQDSMRPGWMRKTHIRHRVGHLKLAQKDCEKSMAKSIQRQITRSSGNVFDDMRLPDAAELDTKA